MKRIVVFFLLLSSNLSAQQQKVISSDSLLLLFQTKQPFEVLNDLKYNIYNLDYKSIYFNDRLKPYLLKWLDKDEYFNYCMRKKEDSYLKDTVWIRNKIVEEFKRQGRVILIDSVVKNSQLYHTMVDSIVRGYMEIVVSENKKNNLCYELPSEAILFHSLLAYPEGYKVIHELWKEKGGEKNNIYFMPLVRLGDPEARKLYDREIEQVIKLNGSPFGMNKMYSELVEMQSSYSLMKLLELTSVDQNFIRFSEGDDGEQFNCVVLKFFVNNIIYYSIEIDNSVKRNFTCEEYLSHLSQVKIASLKLIEKYQKEEYYWMANMPFFKN